MKRLLLLFAIFTIGCQHSQTVVVWISIDGCRGDYVDRADTPNLHRLMREGVYSKQLMPTVPSITFPSHVSEATGVTVSQHGIPLNTFYDSATRQTYKFPDDGSLLQAEPIWLTAKRQGVRTLVHEWPLSHNQQGDVRADYFLKKFTADTTDEDRLKLIIDRWRGETSPGGQPLRLLMGYIYGTDGVGHKYGPDSPQVAAKMTQVDAALGRFVEQAVQVFNAKMSPHDRLYVLITTDHGMMRVHTQVNLRRLLSHDVPANVRIITEGPVGMIYLGDARELQEQYLADLRRFDFLDVYARETLPARWGFDHPTRTGDIVVMLKPGYHFGSKPGSAATTWPIDPRVELPGAHGYPVEVCPEMRGLMILWRYSKPLGGRDLGEVDALPLHPTVAKLLGIKPAHDAHAAALNVE